MLSIEKEYIVVFHVLYCTIIKSRLDITKSSICGVCAFLMIELCFRFPPHAVVNTDRMGEKK